MVGPVVHDCHGVLGTSRGERWTRGLELMMSTESHAFEGRIQVAVLARRDRRQILEEAEGTSFPVSEESPKVVAV